jgi:hypothetical protein
MKKLAVAVVLTALFYSCGPSGKTMGYNKLSREQKDNGWELLFNGRNTKGWHRYGGGSIDSVWGVKDGMLFLDIDKKKNANVRGDWDIVTEHEYDNFHLQLEWMITQKGNSGVIFYIYEDKQKHNWPWETGPEMQVLDNAGHPDAKFQKHRAGDLYDILPCVIETVKPAGEWNQAEIKSENGKLELILNGEVVVSTTMWDDNWRKLIAGSKFRNMAGFGTYKQGRIGLQDHGDGVFYRNIRIRKL